MQAGQKNHFFGHKHSAESRVKIGEAGRGRIPPNKGISPSTETKAKISATLGKYMTEGHRLEVAIRNGSKPVKLQHENGTVIEFINRTEFARQNNLNRAHLNLVILGKRKRTKGWSLYTPINSITTSIG